MNRLKIAKHLSFNRSGTLIFTYCSLSKKDDYQHLFGWLRFGLQLDGYIPGQDYPIYSEIPAGLSFRCEQNRAGYYSDPEAQCQVWHWCLPNGQKFSFLCPNGTVFNQIARVCDWWFNVDCASAPNYYGINEDLYIVPPPYNRRRD